MAELTKAQIKRRDRYLKRRSTPVFSNKEKIIVGVVFVIFAVYAISLIYPFIYLLINSFKDKTEFTGTFNPLTGDKTNPNYFWFTLNPTWSNYIAAFSSLSVGGVETNVGEMFFNSTTLAIGETLVSMAMTCCAAYVLAKYKFVGNKLIYNIVLIASFIPTIAAFPATYKLMMADTKIAAGDFAYFGMILITAGAFGGTFLYIHSYFKQIPWSFAESAMMDGASDFRIFWQIMIPLARNGIGTFAIIKFLGFWNDYWLPYLYYSNHPTLAVGIAGLEAGVKNVGVVYASMVTAVVPVLVFYAVFQKKLLSNTIAGGVKE